MKNRKQLYGKYKVLVVVVGMMLCFVSSVWAAQQQQQSRESKPVVTTHTDVWIDNFTVKNISRDCYITNPGPSGCDIYEGDELGIGRMVNICGTMKPIRVKYEVDAQLLVEYLMQGFQQGWMGSTVYPVANSISNYAAWIAFPGTHILKFTVDSMNEISEINELNSKSVTVTVKRRLLPNF